MKTNRIYVLLMLLIVLLSACKKFVDIENPTTSISSKAVFDNDLSASAVFSGIYSTLSAGSFTGGPGGVSTVCGLSADELTFFAGGLGNNKLVYQNALTDKIVVGPWRSLYSCLESINAAIEGIEKSSKMSIDVKQQLMGEAKFLRAFCFFYLVTLYNDVPLTLSSDWKTNAVLNRAPADEVWAAIVKDLIEAKTLLSSEYLMGNAKDAYATSAVERVRPSKWAATAFLARVYLYMGKWQQAEEESTLVLSNTQKFSLETDLNNVFLKNSKEAIWQLMSYSADYNTTDGNQFVLTSAPNFLKTIYLSDDLSNAFASNDLRKAKWIGGFVSGATTYFYPFKYKAYQFNAPSKEYLMVLRVGEVFLIRSEAKAQQDKITDALADLNKIRFRAGLADTSVATKNALLGAILRERRLELFTEWGHRWLDLKRTKKIDEVMTVVTPLKNNGNPWKSYQQFYPIYSGDLVLNPNLLPNNPGY